MDISAILLTDEFPVMNAAEFTDLKKWANIIANPGLYTGLDPKFLTNGYLLGRSSGLSTGRNTDWQKLIYKRGIITDPVHSGGTDQTQYAISGGYQPNRIYF
jgi:hypothetical protein